MFYFFFCGLPNYLLIGILWNWNSDIMSSILLDHDDIWWLGIDKIHKRLPLTIIELIISLKMIFDSRKTIGFVRSSSTIFIKCSTKPHLIRFYFNAVSGSDQVRLVEVLLKSVLLSGIPPYFFIRNIQSSKN